MNSTNSLSRFLSRVKGTLLLLVALFATIGMHAQTTVNKTFTACALNIDGLPQTMAGVTVNGDGPGAAGTQAIGKYIVDNRIDILGLSEDFNYNGDLIVGLQNNYQMGTWRGRIDASGILSGLHFNTDGLMFLLKNQNSSGQNMSYSNETWVQWEESLGGLSDGANENVDKGYRFYTVNLGDNVKIDVYILHMNTAEGPDQIALQDRQLTQLANAILANGDGRPKLIIGDTNCRYTRNKVVDNLITPLSASYDIKDVWVEKFRNGTAPDYTPDVDDDIVVLDKTNSKAYETGEIVDKIFYLNPKGGNLSFTLKDLVFDADHYKKDDGSLLGDHVPVIAKFTISGTLSDENYTAATQPEFWVGEKLESVASGTEAKAYIMNVGNRTFITYETPSKTDINEAVKWRVTPDAKGETYTFYREDANGKQWRICMNNTRIGVYQRNSGATDFTIKKSTHTEGAYKFDAFYYYMFKNVNHHFNVDADENKYTGAEDDSNDSNNDWLFISEAQKNAYKAYTEAYDNAKGLLTDVSLSELRDDEPELFEALEQVLLETTNTNYTTSEEDTHKLIEAYNNIMNRQSYDVTITESNWGGESYYATLCLPWNAWVPQGVATYTGSFKQDSGDTRYITLNEYNNADKHTNKKTVIPAGIGGYILKTTTTGTFTFFRTGKPTDAPAATNYLKGNPSMDNVMPTETEKGNVYILANKDRGLGFYNLAANNAIRHNCAYIVIEPEKVTQIKRVSFLFDDMPTAIDKAEAAINANATTVYGVAGEQRSALRRGINIVRMSDGTVRKVAVK